MHGDHDSDISQLASQEYSIELAHTGAVINQAAVVQIVQQVMAQMNEQMDPLNQQRRQYLQLNHNI